MTKKEKSNHITMTILDMLKEHNIQDKSLFLSDISSIICIFDTDVAIETMNNFGTEGKEQALSIKINYGY
jgi:L-rhamnose mutarotase